MRINSATSSMVINASRRVGSRWRYSVIGCSCLSGLVLPPKAAEPPRVAKVGGLHYGGACFNTLGPVDTETSGRLLSLRDASMRGRRHALGPGLCGRRDIA